MQFEVRDLVTLGTILFAAGSIYGAIHSFRKEYDKDRVDAWDWRKKIEKALFGDDGRNGLVGDNIIHNEHIKVCKAHIERANRNG